MKRSFLLVCMVLALALAAGCGVKKPAVAPVPAGTQESRADTAWRLRNFTMSEKLYKELLEGDKIPDSRAAEAWKRLVLSAVYAGHPEQALQYLRKWESTHPDADQNWAYHQGYVQTYMQMDMPVSAKNHLRQTLENPAYPASVRVQAGRGLADLHWQRKELMDALGVYKTSYQVCPDQECRAELEKELWDRLVGLDMRILETLFDEGADPFTFPETLLAWHLGLERLRQDPSSWDAVWDELQALAEEGKWADRGFVQGVLERLEARYGHPRESGIALLLPLSGPYSKVGWKILQGAELGQAKLASYGVDVSIRVINSDAPNWVALLEELPSTYPVVGGPLRSSIFKTAYKNELHEEKAFFTFLPSLNTGEEGRDAWRFFGSPRDQVRSLLEVTAEELGISSYAILYPSEQYGLAMSKYFWQEAVKKGGKLASLTSYPPEENRAWSQIVKQSLIPDGMQIPAEEDLVLPDPDFQAVFIPDSLNSARILVPQFHFFDEDRLIFLGPELWTQSWGDGFSRTEDRYFQLSLMPGSWWAENPAPGARELKQTSPGTPDFWMALGYDFIRFAGDLGVPSSWSSRSVNNRLSAIPYFEWSLAPLQWDRAGLAKQDMFVLMPGRDGLVPADPVQVLTQLEEIKQRHQQRLEAEEKNRQSRTAPGQTISAQE